MSTENLILGVNSVVVPYLIRYDSLLQNGTYIITKCNSYFIIKCDRSLLQNASGFLLQNLQFYYKMCQLLQIATILLQNATFFRNCDSTFYFRSLTNNQYKNRNTDTN